MMMFLLMFFITVVMKLVILWILRRFFGKCPTGIRLFLNLSNLYQGYYLSFQITYITKDQFMLLIKLHYPIVHSSLLPKQVSFVYSFLITVGILLYIQSGLLSSGFRFVIGRINWYLFRLIKLLLHLCLKKKEISIFPFEGGHFQYLDTGQCY